VPIEEEEEEEEEEITFYNHYLSIFVFSLFIAYTFI
jgi:hypothetical protein